jgi:hypothetical protein
VSLERHAERWRPTVVAELGRIHSSVPPELVLAAWWQESRGDPNALNPSGATGLGQVLPVALQFYNESTANTLSIADLRGDSPRAVALQARVSIWLYDWNARRVVSWLGPDADPEDVYMLTLVSYHQGWRALRKRLQGLREAGLAVSYETLKRQYPTGWKTPGDRLWSHQDKNLRDWRLLRGLAPGPTPEPIPLPPLPVYRPAPQAIAVVALLLVLGGLLVAGASLAGRTA